MALYHAAGIAMANIFSRAIARSAAFASDRLGDPATLTYNWPPSGVGGDAEDAGDVECEKEGDGVSGVAGELA